MRLRECLREGWRNVASGTSRGTLLGVTLGLLLAALSVADAAAVARLDAQAQAYRASGAAIRVATAQKAINPDACNALSSVEGVESAGALREASPLSLGALGGLTVPAFEVTQSLLRVVGASHAETPGAFVSETLAARWSVEPGDTIATDRGALTIAGVYPYTERDGRDPRFANAVLLPALATGRFDACLADVWPSTSSRDGLLRGTAEGTDGKPGGASVSLLNQSFGTTWEGSAEFEARVTRFAPGAAAVLGAVLGVGAVGRRRLEFSAAVHVGVPHGRLALIVGTESAIWAVAAASGALSAAAVVGAFLSRGTLATMLTASALTCAAGALAALGGAVAAVGTLRESRLFRHFKNRA
ncbi:hypothetical protein [Sinomonas sp. P47F7]|uniref:hypothetical protein n=1 Tax=Sinomonas sp. P47F7 TaxID=3410987 RepID=UPI003BF591C6